MLRIPRDVLDDVYAHAREGVPNEVCGMLAGRQEGDARVVVKAYRIRNAHPRPVGQFLLDPDEQLRAMLDAEDARGLEVLGFYHSHPIGPARLSSTDAARASWPGASYFLVHLQPREGHLSARWDAERQRFEDEEVAVTPN